MDDNKIIELYNQRNEKAIAATADKYGKYCYSIARNILSDRLDCEECVNDTYLVTWNSIPPKQPNYLKLFLAKITRNLSFNIYNRKNSLKRKGTVAHAAIEELADIVSGTANVEGEIDYKRLVESINAFLHTLNERDCNIFIKRYFYLHIAK